MRHAWVALMLVGCESMPSSGDPFSPVKVEPAVAPAAEPDGEPVGAAEEAEEPVPELERELEPELEPESEPASSITMSAEEQQALSDAASGKVSSRRWLTGRVGAGSPQALSPRQAWGRQACRHLPPSPLGFSETVRRRRWRAVFPFEVLCGGPTAGSLVTVGSFLRPG